jgi:tight adherence protein B
VPTLATVLALAIGLIGGAGGFLILTAPVFAHSGGGAGSSARVRPQRSLPWPTIASSVGLGIGVAAVCLVLTGVIGLSLAAGVVGSMTLHVLNRRREQRRLRQVEASYPDLVEAMISQIRSGVGLLQALATAAMSAPPAVAEPARHFWMSIQVSGDADACLDGLKSEWASPTGDAIIETVRVARQVGGTRVIDVLRELAEQIRRERNLVREVEAKQSWVKVAARVGVAAPWVVLVLLSLRAEAAAAYNSPAGITLIVGGFALSLLAYRLMLRLGRTPVPARVFAE